MWIIVRNIVLDSRIKPENYDFDKSVIEAKKNYDFLLTIGKNAFEKTQKILYGVTLPHVEFNRVAASNGNTFRPQPVDTESVILTIKSQQF